ncbi:VWA domain-containing protein [Bacillus sp. V3]|nr:VWA domain-containing protein [Bacillus sp. V3]
MRKAYCVILLSALLVLAGCNENKEDASKLNEKKVEEKSSPSQTQEANKGNSLDEHVEKLPEVPTTSELVVNQTPGVFAGKYVADDPWKGKFLEKMKEAPSLPEEPSEEEYNKYFKYIYSLAAEDFPDPQELLKKWEYALSGTPETTDERFKFKDNYNIEIILDASGSMKNLINGKTQMELAKESIKSFLSEVPEKANVSLRVYGHKGTGSDSDKELSCSSIEQVYGFESYDKDTFNEALNSFEPSGWTPIEGALKASKDALSSYDAKNNTNLIYLVSDGIETCDGSPGEYAKTLPESNVKPIVNVIGFNVDGEAQKQLKTIAENSKGVYTTVTSAEQLEDEFNRTQEVLESWGNWKEDALYDLKGKSNDAYFDIRDYRVDYSQKARSQGNNIAKIIQIMHLEDMITRDQKDELSKRRFEIEDLVKKTRANIESDLENASSKKLTDLKKEINEKYNSNVSQE